MIKTAIITGGSTGIGLAVTGKFLEEGYRVFNLSRQKCPLEGVVSESVDLSVESELENCLERLKKEFREKSSITLVHNAFSYVSDHLEAFSAKAILKSFQVGVLSPMKMNQVFLPLMGEGSSIIFIGSTLSEKGVAKAMSYVTLKHAIVGLMRSVAQDLYHHKGIHTVCVCPGFTRTKMLEEHLKKTNSYDLVKNKVLFKRLLEPEEMANLVYFCAENPLVNGSVIHANLGQVES